MKKLSPYEASLAKAEENGILIVQGHTSSRFKAAALRCGSDMGVFIDEASFKSDTERRLAFVHEIAHCETGGFYTERTPEDERERIDYKANQWTVMRLVPFDVYEETIKLGYFADWEQAERWDVPTFFVPTVHNIYESTRWHDVQRLRLLMSQNGWCYA